jgi:formylglycine-generating enzyme required for sulfatase activity
MRTLVIISLLAALCAACADEPAQDATPAEPTWLNDCPENTHPYANATLTRFRKLVEGVGWGDAAWNAQGTLETVHEKTGLTFVLIPAGEFMMGSEDGNENERPVHMVQVPAFMLCKTECTQRAWVRGGGTNWSEFRGDSRPVERIGWDDCHAWREIVRLRLPSESEWEYACRAGSKGQWCFGEAETKLKEFGWYFINSGSRTLPAGTPRDPDKARGEWGCAPQPVGELKPNAFGIHDMHGNVSEWCQDWYEWSYEKTPLDGSAVSRPAPDTDSDLYSRILRISHGPDYRSILRGGGWSSSATECRSAGRSVWTSSGGASVWGFRPAADLPR